MNAELKRVLTETMSEAINVTHWNDLRERCLTVCRSYYREHLHEVLSIIDGSGLIVKVLGRDNFVTRVYNQN